MNRLLFLVLFLAFFSLQAQVEVDGQATGKHSKAINAVKKSRDATKERRRQIRQYKQQVKDHKKAKELYGEKYDSLRAIRRSDINVETITIEDSLAISNQILSETGFPAEYKALMLEPPVLAIDSTATEGFDDALMSELENELETSVRELAPEELTPSQDPLGQLTEPEGVPGLSQVRNTRPNPNLVKPDVARQLFKKVDPEQFSEAQAEIQKLKKKYSELPDTRYPKEGTKRNSLQNIPFAKRLYFGGNINISSTDPLIISSNFQLGYWINKKWMAGAGITLREQFSNADSSSLVRGDGYGFSFFTRYDIPKSFFIWAEGEFQVNRSVFGETRTTNTNWEQAHLLGIGREFKIGKVSMMSIILYDFNYQNNELNARPLVFKMGVRVSKKPGG